MPELPEVGRTLVLLGAVLLALGVIIGFAGRLPGDIVIERRNFTLYIPVAACIVLSLLLSLFFWIVGRK